MPRKRVAEPQPFVIRGSAIQGRGGFATRAIRKGERIAEYLGERISWKEADRRYEDAAMDRHHTFLFSVTSRSVLDGAVGGSEARYINHSCAPNCEAVDERGHIFIEAIRPILSGEELTYDYAYERDATHTEEDESLYACHCGAANCRGTILAPPAEKVAAAHHAAARRPHRHEGAKATEERTVVSAGRLKKTVKPHRTSRGAKR
jgi:SET domain-containing protein